MVATVIIERLTGAGPTATAITGINTRANAADTHSTAGTTYPITIPSSGTNRSFWVVTRLKVTVAGGFTQIDNIQWHTDGSAPGGDVVIKVAAASDYTRAINVADGTTPGIGKQLNDTDYTSITVAVAAATAKTAGPPLAVAGGNAITAAGTTTAGGNMAIIVYQIEVGTSASAGAVSAETFTWLYDET